MFSRTNCNRSGVFVLHISGTSDFNNKFSSINSEQELFHKDCSIGIISDVSPVTKNVVGPSLSGGISATSRDDDFAIDLDKAEKSASEIKGLLVIVSGINAVTFRIIYNMIGKVKVDLNVEDHGRSKILKSARTH